MYVFCNSCSVKMIKVAFKFRKVVQLHCYCVMENTTRVANFLQNPTVNEFWKLANIFQNYEQIISLVCFLTHSVYWKLPAIPIIKLCDDIYMYFLLIFPPCHIDWCKLRQSTQCSGKVISCLTAKIFDDSANNAKVVVLSRVEHMSNVAGCFDCHQTRCVHHNTSKTNHS